MNKSGRDVDDLALESLFDAARADPPRVPEVLMARVIADAQTFQPNIARTKWQGWQGWQGWLRAIGGLPALGGLVTATCVGFWLGVAPPEGLPDLAGQVLGQQDSTALETATALTGFGWDIEETNADG